MKHITLDSLVVNRLRACTERVEVRDVDGNVVGHFFPLNGQAEAELYALAAKVFDPEELDRIEREESDKGVPYTEVKKRLEALENHT